MHLKWQCDHCAHRIDNPPGVDPDDNLYDGPTICRAFPGGIPREIYTTDFDHRKPFPGDRGFRFVPLFPDMEYPSDTAPEQETTDTTR